MLWPDDMAVESWECSECLRREPKTGLELYYTSDIRAEQGLWWQCLSNVDGVNQLFECCCSLMAATQGCNYSQRSKEACVKRFLKYLINMTSFLLFKVIT